MILLSGHPTEGLLLFSFLVEVSFLQLELGPGRARPLSFLVVRGVAFGRAAVLEHHVVVVLVFVHTADDARHCGCFREATTGGQSGGCHVEDDLLRDILGCILLL